MGPKNQKKSTVYQESFSLDDPINSDDWRCAVVLILEAGPKEVVLSQIFAEEASKKSRKAVKTIDFNTDVMNTLKTFMIGEVEYKNSYLLNYSSVFEEAREYVRNSENIPVSLLVRIIKAMIFMFKRENELERKGKTFCNENPIRAMAEILMVPTYGREAVDRYEDDRKSERKKSSLNGISGVRIKLPTPVKEDTKLRRRGELEKAISLIDDAPDNSFFNIYVALTSFRDPELTLEMLKEGIPLHGIIRLFCPYATVPFPAPNLSINFERFWQRFIDLLWNPSFNHYFTDVAFQTFNILDIPNEETEIRNYIFKEISFIMYDLSDLKHQLHHYLRNMRLWKVTDESPPLLLDTSELDDIPLHCLNVPLIMQSILNTVSKGDPEYDYAKAMRTTLTFEPSSAFFRNTSEKLSESFTSLLPLTSTVKLPTPQWSSIIDSPQKQKLYLKMISLDAQYDMNLKDVENVSVVNEEEVGDGRAKEPQPCKNSELEIEVLAEAMLKKIWSNYPIPEKNISSQLNNINVKLNYPELTINFLLYIIWITKTEEKSKERPERISITDSIGDFSETRFTVTDGSRIALQKMRRPSNFFSPSQLKVIPPEMLSSVSAPELRSTSQFSWNKKSFVSDTHIPLKYLQGAPMTVFDELRKCLGEETFSKMKDYEFIEMLNKKDLIQKIQDSMINYESVRHAYLPLTDSIYIVVNDELSATGFHRDAYNVMLTTPVGLRDFYNYILDDEKSWIMQHFIGWRKKFEECSDSLYNPTPDFRDFTTHDFWHENSIKYQTYEGEILESVMQKISSEDFISQSRRIYDDERRFTIHPSFARSGESYTFVGFDFDPGAIQFSGMETTFKGPDNCIVRAALHERLYGSQLLGVHIQLGGHNLHLYNWSCPKPHVDQPYTCHVEMKNGTIIAFSRRIYVHDDLTPDEDSSGPFPKTSFYRDFAYDMKMSLPHGLTVETVRKHIQPCYIKQCNMEKKENVTNPEKCRLYLPNGSIIVIMEDKTVQVFKADASVFTANMNDLVPSTSEKLSDLSGLILDDDDDRYGQQMHFQSYTFVKPDGYEVTVAMDEVRDIKLHHLIVKTEKETQHTYYRRLDGTYYVMAEDGSMCVEFPDGSKICTYLHEQEIHLNDFNHGEDDIDSVYHMVHMRIVMEHPDYATGIYDTRSSWKLMVSCQTEVEIDTEGCYQLHLDRRTEMDISTNTIRMWRYNARDECIMNTNADLTAFENSNVPYVTTCDNTGKKFIIEACGVCYVTENVWSECDSVITSNCHPEVVPAIRYFVVNRDLTGFEIVHTKKVQNDFENLEPDMVVYTEELETTPVTRYFVLLKEIDCSLTNKWMVDSITPRTSYVKGAPATSSTYGIPPSWMHPFPKKKRKIPKPSTLHGRILLETNQTDLATPRANKFMYCDTSEFPEIILTEKVAEIMRRVARQDQDMLREIYFVAARRHAPETTTVYSKSGQEVLKYLMKSKYHTTYLNQLKNYIRLKKVPKYFDCPPGIAWLTLHDIIKLVVKEDELKAEFRQPSMGSSVSVEPSEVEYNLNWSTDVSFSDLTMKSNVSSRTAPEMSRLPICECLLPKIRRIKSEPNYKMTDFPNDDDDALCGYKFETPPSRICVFTKEDLITLENKSSSRGKQLSGVVYQLDDLVRLGFV